MKEKSNIENHGSTASYSVGFVLSLIFTIIPYILVVNGYVVGWTLVWLLALFAATQLVVQLVFFLHFGREQKPRWNIVSTAFMLLLLLIVVIGSIWIMRNLHYNSQTPEQAENYLLHDEGIAH